VIAGGYEGNPDNFCVIRLTVPSGSNGVYRVEGSVRSHVNGSLSGDADFHVLHNGVEVFGQNVPTNSAASFTQLVSVSGGDTIDFASGRGADGHEYGSGLKIQASVDSVASNTNLSLVVPEAARDHDSGGGADDFRSVMRIQECYGGSNFPQQPITIRELRFRPSAAVGAAFSATISNIQINLSTTTRNPENLSATFASNVGPDNTVIVDGAWISLAASSDPQKVPRTLTLSSLCPHHLSLILALAVCWSIS
jgi:hypothetical protein